MSEEFKVEDGVFKIFEDGGEDLMDCITEGYEPFKILQENDLGTYKHMTTTEYIFEYKGHAYSLSIDSTEDWGWDVCFDDGIVECHEVEAVQVVKTEYKRKSK